MIIDYLSNSELYLELNPRISAALKFLQDTDFNFLEPGRHDIDGDNIYALINDYDTKDKNEAKLEAHKKYIDVQFAVKGNELIGYKLLSDEKPSKVYDEKKDLMLFDEEPDFFELNQGMFAIFFPNDLHMPGISASTPQKMKKVVIKVKIAD